MDKEKIKLLVKVLGIFLLIFALLFVLNYTELISCREIEKVIPFWCDLYHSIIGPPKILIVYGNSGLGEPNKLLTYLRDPRLCSAKVNIAHLSQVSDGLLREYDVVIVEKARRMSGEQLKMFADYALDPMAGKLVWVGDSGVADSNDSVVGWVRNLGKKKILRFDKLISVSYVGNYCEIRECEKEEYVGNISPSSGHEMTKGILPSLEYYGDLTLVELIPGSHSKTIFSIDFSTPLYVKTGKSLERFMPVVVSSPPGDKVFYFSIPPERFVDLNYVTIFLNFYKSLYR